MVACIASGPSLTKEDCEAVHAAGLPTVVTNTSFRLAPWADILFGFDGRWWDAHLSEVKSVFSGRLVSYAIRSASTGIEHVQKDRWFTTFGNSGACAISIAIALGAKRVLLLGYDCSRGPAGEKHWHGDHPHGMSNCASMSKWQYQFGQVAKHARAKGVDVINASRRTALRCFEKQTLEQALGLTVEA